MPSPAALVHPMENSSMTDAGSNQRPTKFSYSSSVTVSKTIAILVLIVLLLLLLSAIIIPIIVYQYATCSANSDSQEATVETTVSPSPQIGTSLNYRLPRNLIPIRYTVHLKTYIPSSYVVYDPSSEFTFDGNVSILMLCNFTTNVVILHTKKLNISTSSLSLFELDDNKNRRDSKRIEIDVNNVEELDDLEQIRIPLKEKLIESKLYRIYANYRGELSSDLAGFYKSSYEEEGVIKWLSVTQFQPTSARRALPCFDEPDFKAVFSVKLTNPRNMVALSNMMDLKRQDDKNGWSTTYFKDSPKMSSYLLAFVISEFSYRSIVTAKGITFRIWARPSQIEFTSLALEKGPKLLEMYEDYFNISFPLEKQDMVAIPDFDAGAMENWGLITYRESLLLASKGASSSSARQKLVEVMAHELAHQWFGNLVTMDWWDDIWLNEGFSMYMQFMGADHAFDGKFKMYEQFVIASLHISMEFDQMTTSHPLHVRVNNPTEIFQIFDSITYDKGASVIRMLQDVVGEKVFQKALRQYLNEYKYSNANHHDLWDSLTKVVQTDLTTRDWNNEPLNITELMTCWTEQMGYPLVTVERNYQKRTVTLNQNRFKIDESIPDNPKFANNTFGYKWYIPIKYATGTAPTEVQTAWVTPGKELTLSDMIDSNSWVLINQGVPGFYRTNYDLTNWQLLRSQLLTNNQVIDNRSRAHLIEDAFTLARVGKLPYNVALSLTEYMPNENTFIAWHACLSNFKWIKERLIQTEYTSLAEVYFRRLVESAYHRVGYEVQSEITDDVSHKLRATIWQYSCEFGLQHCVHVATKLFKEYRDNCTDAKLKSSSECNKLSPNLRQIIYCTGIAESKSTDDWEFLWKKYVLEDFSVEKIHILYGLSCSRNPALVKKYLDKASEGTDIRNADVGIAFILVSQNPIGMNMLWNYVKNNWSKFVSKFDLSHSLSAIVKAATVGFTTEPQLKEMTKFIKDNAKSLGSSKLAFDQRVEETKANIAWMAKYSNEVIGWLKEHASSAQATL